MNSAVARCAYVERIPLAYPAPSPRTGHTLCHLSPLSLVKSQAENLTSEQSLILTAATSPKTTHPSTTLICFGGASHETGVLDDTWIYGASSSHSNPKPSSAWHPWDNQSKSTAGLTHPPGRYEHSAVKVAENEFWVLFGAGEEGVLNDVWSFTIHPEDGGVWSSVHTRAAENGNDIPQPRALASCIFLPPHGGPADVVGAEGCILAWGGGRIGNIPVADENVYLLDVKTKTWTRLHVPEEGNPVTRLGHMCALLPARVGLPQAPAHAAILMCGGMHEEGDLTDGTWVLEVHLESKSATWTNYPNAAPSVQGNARSAATMVSTQDTVLCFGGVSLNPPHPQVLEDMLEWEQVSHRWVPVELIPVAGKGNSEDGVSSLESISPRLNHAMSISSSSGKIILTGGMDFTTVFQDMYKITLDE